jgi:hypothetical protein
LATKGKVFTLQTMDKLVEYTRLREFVSRLDTNGVDHLLPIDGPKGG